ncbi:MAG: putative lipid II flippase FtsW [Treponema sp.]|nr:putative lipid II flippase FtsW [Treponema sp.]
MFHFDAERIQNKKTLHAFYFCIILLLGTGLASLYSASYAYSQRFMNDGNKLITRQLVFSAIGIVLFIISSRINLGILRKNIIILLGLSAVLCILTLVPEIGKERHGATRWIEINSVSYQPSEMVKFVLPLYLAHLFDKKGEKINDFFSGILPPVLVIGLFFTLIYIQNNFSTAVFIVINALAIFFIAGLRYRYFISAFVMIAPISILLVFTKEHRWMRIISFLRPEWEPMGAGFQVKASRDAIVSGGLLGKGIGEGTRKIASVPEIQSDFIFSSYAEETGLIGIVLFFILFAALGILGYSTALRSDTVFGRLLASGLTTMLVSQALLNVAVVSGALPATGIPLPFFSAGGSSLTTTLICAGLIANVARKGGANSGYNTFKNKNYNYSGDME